MHYRNSHPEDAIGFMMIGCTSLLIMLCLGMLILTAVR